MLNKKASSGITMSYQTHVHTYDMHIFSYMCIYVYRCNMHMCICAFICVYIQIHREREVGEKTFFIPRFCIG